MNCPYCNTKLREIYFSGIGIGFICPNPNCKTTEHLKGNEPLWQELSKTKQALDLSVDTMERMKKVVDNSDISEPLFGVMTTNISFELLNTLNQIKQIIEIKA